MPPRRTWARPSRENRTGSSKARTAELSILNAVRIAQRCRPAPAWLLRLRSFVKDARSSLFRTARLNISTPHVTLIPKDKVKRTFRPLATFPLKEQVIIGAAADCLRRTIDSSLSKSCYAFRAAAPGQSVIQHHDAVDDLRSYIVQRDGRPLFVAECDIQKFFDAVSHDVAMKSLEDILRTIRMSGRYYDQRLVDVMRAYLASYSFVGSVDQKIPSILEKMKVASGTVPWVRDEIARYYPDGIPSEIGVPQGGALSPVIANIVLNVADNAVRDRAIELGTEDFFYARYCDDMVIISTSRDVTQALFESYLAALRKLRLPYHPPSKVKEFSEDYFAHKSKDVYSYGSARVGGVVHWLAFLGYQIRYDGKLRVRRSSISKEIEKQIETYKSVVRSISISGEGMRVSGRQALHRTRMRLIAMSVGNATISKHGPDAEHEMCWVNGFELLKKYPHARSQLKTLDRVRAKLLTKLARRLKRVPKKTETTVLKGPLKFYGRPFSYFAQFNRD